MKSRGETKACTGSDQSAFHKDSKLDVTPDRHHSRQTSITPDRTYQQKKEIALQLTLRFHPSSVGNCSHTALHTPACKQQCNLYFRTWTIPLQARCYTNSEECARLAACKQCTLNLRSRSMLRIQKWRMCLPCFLQSAFVCAQISRWEEGPGLTRVLSIKQFVGK